MERLDFGKSKQVKDTRTNTRMTTSSPNGPQMTPPPALRTVTRKEIVPGVYGGLEVGQSVNGMVFLAMPIANFGREQIETLIDNLGTVRDALEEQ